MRFPLNKKIKAITNSKYDFLSNYDVETEIPINPHPGSFGVTRKHHNHEGVDLYCNKNDIVVAIEKGVIVNIKPFTGLIAQAEHWNDTYCVMVEGKSGVFNYGEIIPLVNLKIGIELEEGEIIGHVETVLKKDKGRPMNMLHLELYTNGTIEPIKEWALGEVKPKQLLDPTNILLSLMKN